MSIHRPAYKRKAVEAPLQARQAQTKSASSSTPASFPVPTNRVVLSTAFEGPSTCSQNLLTMLPPPSYQIWANEPVPAENQTIAACHATEFLQSYTAVMVGSTPSSIVPAMTNFACPKNYCTALASARNYVVCCPSNYQFHAPDTTVDSNRPFYGGTCYSDMTSGSSYPVVRYNTNGDTASTLFPATSSGVQAYAHPIDGFAATSPTALGCSKALGSASLATDSSSRAQPSISGYVVPLPAPSASTTSPGVIAGAVVASVLGLAAIVGLIFFLLAYRRKHASSSSSGSTPSSSKNVELPVPPPKSYAELGGSRASSAYGREDDEKSVFAHRAVVAEVNGGQGAFEMPAEHAVELDAAGAGAVAGKDKGGRF